MKLLLFDIDGTLLTTDGAGRTAMRQVAKELFSLEEDLTGITIDGNTDGGIVREILAKHALPVTKENINRYLEGYLIRLKKTCQGRAERFCRAYLICSMPSTQFIAQKDF